MLFLCQLWKGVGVAVLIVGVIWIIGGATRNDELLDPLYNLTHKQSGKHLEFKRIKGLDQLANEVAKARAAGKTVLLDFYADWCIECKRMEKKTMEHII